MRRLILSHLLTILAIPALGCATYSPMIGPNERLDYLLRSSEEKSSPEWEPIHFQMPSSSSPNKTHGSVGY